MVGGRSPHNARGIAQIFEGASCVQCFVSFVWFLLRIWILVGSLFITGMVCGYNGYIDYNRGWPSATLFKWSAADWSRPATNNSISSERKRKSLLFCWERKSWTSWLYCISKRCSKKRTCSRWRQGPSGMEGVDHSRVETDRTCVKQKQKKAQVCCCTAVVSKLKDTWRFTLCIKDSTLWIVIQSKK